MEISPQKKLIEYRWKHSVGVIVVVCFIVALLALWLLPSPAFQMVLGSIWVLFVPGWLLTLAFFPKPPPREEPTNAGTNDTSLEPLERITLACLLSIAVVPTSLFIAHKLGTVLTPVNVAIVIGIVSCLCAFMTWLKLRSYRKN